MKNRLKLIALILILTPLANAKIYVLKKGETLASVARQIYGEPVFGPKGSLNKIFALNPKLKSNANSVEPGQEITIDDSVPEKKTSRKKKMVLDFEPTQEAKIESKPILQAPEPIVKKEDTVLPNPNPKEEIPQLTEPPHDIVVVSKPPTEAAAKPQVAEATKTEMPVTMKSRFFLSPTYSQIQLKTTHLASGSSLDLTSSSVFGALLGWDQTWSRDFSTLLSADYKAFKSDSTSSVTAAPVVDSADLYRIEFSLLNRIGKYSRFGLGISYGQDLFIQTDAGTLVPTTILATEFAPFLLGDFSLREMHQAELRGQLKVTYHSGEADTAHDTKKGIGIMAGMKFERQFHRLLSWSLGISLETSDQARVGMTQKRTDATVDLGISY